MMSLKAAIGIPQLAIGKMNFWISLRLVCDSDESVQNFLSFEFHLTMTCLQDPRNADLVSGFRLVNGCVFRKFKVKKKFKGQIKNGKLSSKRNAFIELNIN